MALFVSPAFALQTHGFKFSFGAASNPVPTPVNPYPLSNTSDVAVDESTGDIYAADPTNFRIEKFSPSGAFVLMFGKEVNETAVNAAGSEAEQNVCQPPDTCVAGKPGSGPGAFEGSGRLFLAVDNAPGGEGDIYVGDTGDNTITKFDHEGHLIPSWGTAGQRTGDGSESFVGLAGIAVDSAGSLDVFQVEGNSLFKFTREGGFVEKLTLGDRGTKPVGLAVDPIGNFFKVNGNGSVEKIGSTASDIGTVSFGNEEAPPGLGLAIDPVNGDLYVDNAGDSIDHYAFNNAGEVIEPHGSTCAVVASGGCGPTDSFGSEYLDVALGLATGPGHGIYAAGGESSIAVFDEVTLPDAETEAASSVTATSATLHGTVNPSEVPLTQCFFEWGETVQFGNVVPCTEPDAVEVGAGGVPVAVHAKISTRPGTTYHFRLVAANARGATTGDELSFSTPGPTVTAVTVSEVTTTSARISGLINPHGESTNFEVQYVTDADFLESGFVKATGMPLPPEEIGSGTELVPVTQQIVGLVPGTAYHFRVVARTGSIENVGFDKTFSTYGPASANLPDGRAYEMVSPPKKLGDVIPPFPNSSGILGGTCAQGCLPGETSGSRPVQSAPDGETVVYEGQGFTVGGEAQSYLAGRTPTGWQTQSVSLPQLRGGEEQGLKALSTDLSKSVFLQVEPSLSAEAPSREGKSYADLYLRNADGSLRPLITSQPPERSPGELIQGNFRVFYAGANSGTDSSPALSHVVFAANDALTPDAPAVGAEEKNLYEWVNGQLLLVNVLPNHNAAAGAVIGSGLMLAKEPILESPAVDHAISADGTKIFWSDAAGQVYVRIDGKETLKIEDSGNFLTATPDGKKVLLNDGCLYELQIEAPHIQHCTDLTTDQSDVHHGGFQGILGSSEDLSRVYFVDTAALTEKSEENGNHEHSKAGEFNLYAWHEGVTSFIGALLERSGAEGDNRYGLQNLGAWHPASADRTAQVSPDGRYLAFMSVASLTGYDNAASGGGNCRPAGPLCPEVFEYDAVSGRLICASCNPTNQRPIGLSNLSVVKGGLSQLHNLTAGGRLFFESQDVLSAGDTNGHIQDVYEWVPNGVGSCRRVVGCVSLISRGQGSVDSFFFDATPNGDNAFIVTYDQLLAQDKNEQFDLYDARAGGGIAEEATHRCVNLEACRGPFGVAPEQLGPGTSTFSGAGNRRHKHKKHKHSKHKRPTKHNAGGSQ